MNNKYGFDLNEYTNSIDRITYLLQGYLNKGRLSLFLGAGASFALDLPNWEKLVRGCISDLNSDNIIIDKSKEFDPKYYSEKFKRNCTDLRQYHEIIRANLYKEVSFNFMQAQKELLIALTAIIVGKSRGTVKKIITYNFDNVIEWYLEINGLRINVLNKRPLDQSEPDVEILHLHGFLPPSNSKWPSSEEIVFTQNEFNVRERGSNYWKDIVNELYKSHIFLGIGLNPDSVCKDIVPYLQVLDAEWYSEQNPRTQPYGVVFLTNCTEEQSETMIDNGIIPCIIKKEAIPEAVFTIAQKATLRRI